MKQYLCFYAQEAITQKHMIISASGTHTDVTILEKGEGCVFGSKHGIFPSSPILLNPYPLSYFSPPSLFSSRPSLSLEERALSLSRAIVRRVSVELAEFWERISGSCSTGCPGVGEGVRRVDANDGCKTKRN